MEKAVVRKRKKTRKIIQGDLYTGHTKEPIPKELAAKMMALPGRDGVLLSLALLTGLRNTELRTLTWSVFLDKWGGCKDEIFVVISKQSNLSKRETPVVRPIAIVPGLKKKIDAYYKHLKRPPVNDYLFFNALRSRGTKPLSLNGINEIVKNAARECGGENWKSITTHSLRKTFITNYYHYTGDLALTMQMTGHSSVEQLKTYLGLTKEKVLRGFADYYTGEQTASLMEMIETGEVGVNIEGLISGLPVEEWGPALEKQLQFQVGEHPELTKAVRWLLAPYRAARNKALRGGN